MTKTWLEPADITVPAELEAIAGGHPLVAQTLVRRGITHAAAARSFLDPDLYVPTPATELPGIEAAVNRLRKAILGKETICVWGDFDVDGQTSTALLVAALRQMGARVTYHIPIRGPESHGISLPVLAEMIARNRPGVLLTCDTGISAHSAVEFAASKGVDVIISDHHELPPELPPALAVINPKLLSNHHPLANLPGVGVAYKLVEELYNRLGLGGESEASLDLVALGIVADLALQTGDVRYLLQRGLQSLRATKRIGLQIMMKMAELDPTWLSEEHISYVLAPRLNALGRLGDANPVVEFLTSADSEQARWQAEQMEVLNTRRKLLTDQVFQAAIGQLERDPTLLEEAVIVLAHPAWPAGVIGIVASRLVERYARPVVLIANPPGEAARGSARSVEGINISAAIAAQQDMLLSFGGHPMAAGLSLPSERIPNFRRALSRTVSQMLGAGPPVSALRLDGYLPLSALTLELVAELERLAPFGPGNPPLVLVDQGLAISGYASVGRGDEHLLLTVQDEDGNEQRVIWWQGAGWPLPEGRFDLAYTVRASTFRGQRDLQIEWVDWRPAEGDSINLAPLHRTIQVVDYRQATDPLAKLRQLQTEAELQVWSEALSLMGIEAHHRQQLTPCQRLAIWSIPPGPAELRAALKQASPEFVYLFANDPGMDQPEAFLKRLAGLLKHVLKDRQGRTTLSALAAATAQRQGSVTAGINWLESQGYIQVLRREGDELWVAQGNGQRAGDSEQAAARVKHLLEETAAYRRYYCSASAQALIESGEG